MRIETSSSELLWASKHEQFSREAEQRRMISEAKAAKKASKIQKSAVKVGKTGLVWNS